MSGAPVEESEVTVRRIADLDALGLTVVAGHSGLGRGVRWVHVSETVDPTPWLRGGEFLLTTGLSLHGDAEFDDYLTRLVEAGLAGVGFGVGLKHETVPPGLIEAADRHGLPVLAVPIDTPYMAISEAVSAMLAEARHRNTARAFAGHQSLARAALAGGAGEVVRALARLLGGRVMHVDADGRRIASAPDVAAQPSPSLLRDLSRLRQAGANASATVDDGRTAIQPLAIDGVIRGYLVAGADQLGEYERLLLSGAVLLLALETERSRTVSLRMHRVRAHALSEMLLAPRSPESAGRQLAMWRMPAESLRVLVVTGGPTAIRQAYDKTLGFLVDQDVAGAATVLKNGGGRSIAAVLTESADTERVLAHLDKERFLSRVYYGVGRESGSGQLPESYRSALRAARVGRIEGRPVTRAEDARALDLILRSGSPEQLAEFARNVLGPLALAEAQGRELTLRETLIAFLDNNGHWNETAAAVGVHRHTLRSRIETIEKITDRDLSSSYTRMEMWLAILTETGEDTRI